MVLRLTSGGGRGEGTVDQPTEEEGSVVFRAWLLVGDPDPQALVGSSARLEILHLPARKAPHTTWVMAVVKISQQQAFSGL